MEDSQLTPAPSKNSVGLFVWKIPSISHEHKSLLCHAFVKDNCSKYIIDDIINLFATYYSNCSFTLNDIKNAYHLQRFESPIFAVGGFQFYLELHPNGSNGHNKGQIILFCCLAMLPPNISKLSASYKLTLDETNTEFSLQGRAFESDDSYCSWPRYTLKTEKIHHVKQLTFKMELIKLSVFDKNNLLIPNANANEISDSNTIQIQNEYLPIGRYKWIINDSLKLQTIQNAEECEGFNSKLVDIGGFKWYLRFCPNYFIDDGDKGDKIWFGLKLIHLPHNVKKILFNFELLLDQIEFVRFGHKCFDKDHLCIGWCIEKKEQDVLKLSQGLTFYFEIQIIDIIGGTIANNTCMNSCSMMNDYVDKYTFKQVDNIPTIEYEWKIKNAENDMETIEIIKNAENVCSFVSPIFSAFSAKWYISISPNGSRTSRAGTVNIFLNLASLSPSSLEICFCAELEFVEAHKTHSVYHTYSLENACWGETRWPLKTKDIQHLDVITLKVKIGLIDMYVNGTLMLLELENFGNRYPKAVELNELLIDKHYWVIQYNMFEEMCVARNGADYLMTKFEMFGMRWFVTCYPNGIDEKEEGFVNLCVHGLNIPQNVGSVAIRYTLCMMGTGVKVTRAATLTQKNPFASWGTERLLTEKFQNLSRDTIKLFTLQMELLEINYD